MNKSDRFLRFLVALVCISCLHPVDGDETAAASLPSLNEITTHVDDDEAAAEITTPVDGDEKPAATSRPSFSSLTDITTPKTVNTGKAKRLKRWAFVSAASLGGSALAQASFTAQAMRYQESESEPSRGLDTARVRKAHLWQGWIQEDGFQILLVWAPWIPQWIKKLPLGLGILWSSPRELQNVTNLLSTGLFLFSFLCGAAFFVDLVMPFLRRAIGKSNYWFRAFTKWITSFSPSASDSEQD